MKTNEILLIGGGAVIVYLLTRPKTTAYPPGYVPPTYNPYAYQPPNQTSGLITAGGSALSSILNAISNF
jgi:hypothetical protein